MTRRVLRGEFLGSASAAAVLPKMWASEETRSSNAAASDQPAQASSKTRIVEMHLHFDDQRANFIPDLLKLSDRLNLTACLVTPFTNRKVVADAAKEHPRQIVPFGFVDLDPRNVVKQVGELHAMGYRGLGELEFVKKPYSDSSYFPVYELANRYGWIVLCHTGIVLRKKFDEPEDVASGRIAPDLFGVDCAAFSEDYRARGALCHPEDEWAAEIARWNSNVFFDLSGSTLTKMHGRLAEFQKIFWWSATKWHSAEWTVKTPNNDPSAFIKIVFGSDTDLSEIESGESVPSDVRSVRHSGAHAEDDHGRDTSQDARLSD